MFFRLAFPLSVALVLCAPIVRAEVQWKTRKEGQSRLENRFSRAKTRQMSRSHLILDFETTPTPEIASQLKARGMRVVGYLPITGMIVGFDGNPDLAGLPIQGFDALQPEDRLSPELAKTARDGRRESAWNRYYIIDFHGDVAWEERRALVAEAGLEIRDHRDLAGDHMLVRGTLDQVRSLAEWDEVAYIFPASGELVTGLPLIGCLGGATEAGQVGQLTQRVGEGWDGPGLNAAALTYSMQGMPRGLSEDLVQDEIRRAMAAWSHVVQVKFQRNPSSGGTKNINILFGARDHGDPYPFDGAGKVLAHTFYPAPPNPEPIAGDLHFDGDEAWNLGSDIDVFSVALHELGHALGLGHSDVPNAVMYPYYRRTPGLTPEDIGAIRLLYATAGESGDGNPAPVVLTVTSPVNSSTTQAAAVSSAGTVTGPSAAPSVTWIVTAGATGTATVTSDGRGGFQWQVASIPLALGENRITVTAVDATGQSASRLLTVQRLASPTSPPTPPTPNPTPNPVPNPTPAPAPLVITLGSHAASATVDRNPIVVFGATTGGTGRPSVRWSSDRGYSGTAVISQGSGGAYRWDINPLALQPGANTITVSAADAANPSVSLVMRLNYNVPSTDNPTADATPPQLKIISPNTSFLMTPAYSLAVRGTAIDSSGVTEVRWECSCGSRGLAQGATQWTIPNISLPIGTFVIKVIAKDAFGNEGTTSFTVFHYAN